MGERHNPPAQPPVLGRRWLSALIFAALVGLPQPAVASVQHESLASFSAQVELGSVLGPDGAFKGNPAVNGIVNPAEWTLVSDLAHGEAPRFEPTKEQPPASSAALWSGLGEHGANGALISAVSALVVIGSELYVGGSFWNAAGIPEADYIARWNGSSWSALGSNGAGNGALNAEVSALVVVDGQLYAGGWFTNAAGIPEADYIARWNGTSWSALGSNGAGNGALNGAVFAVSPASGQLYVGGRFTNAGGIAEADYIARWNGTSWSALGSNGGGNGALNKDVQAVLAAGSDVYVGGEFSNAAGIAQADYIARWNGTSWSALGSNVAGNNGALNLYVQALAMRDGQLYVGGQFENAAGIAEADYIARWNGSNWFPLGSNGAGDGALRNSVKALVFIGSDLYVGGNFTFAAGIAGAHYLARWSGSTWFAVGATSPGDALNGQVAAIVPLGGSIYIGGSFTNVDGRGPADYVAAWDGAKWSALGSDGGENGAVKAHVRAIALVGSDVYVGGSFGPTAGINRAQYVARWDGSRWSALGSNGANPALNGGVSALAVIGSDLYVGGGFTNAGGVAAADYVARWDGTAWHALGSNGSGDGALNGSVTSLAVAGSALIVGGSFTNAAGLPAADFIARWSGTSWSALGSNGTGNGALNHWPHALVADGSNIYVGGAFTNVAGNAAADYVARWNGSSWSALGSNGAGNGAIGSPGAEVYALALSGSDLYVGGYFENVAGIAAADYIARWNGSSWSALGSNGAGNGALNQGPSQAVHALLVSGGNLYVGGWFNNAAGIAVADNIARWNGSSWSAIDGGVGGNGSVNDDVSVLVASGSHLYLGGAFANAAGLPEADYVARWSGLTPDAADTTPPVVHVPSQRLVAPQKLGATAKVRLSWPPASDPSGIARYDLQMRRDGGSWSTVSLPSATATSVDVSLVPGSSYRFRLRARDGAGNVGAWATAPDRKLVLRQERHSSITYTGSWKRVQLSGASGGYVRRSTVAGSRAEWSFSGSGAAFVSTLGPNRGIAEVWLDGTRVATVDLYAPSRRPARVVWAGSFGAGNHTLQIRVTGQKSAASTGVRVDVDAFLIYP